MLKRRIDIICIIFGLLILLFYLYVRFIEPNLLCVKNITVETDSFINDCKVVFFTDTHFGKLYSEKNVERIVKNINDQDPDIVIFGGDYFDHYFRDKDLLNLEYLENCMSNIQAKCGKYAVWGNHDLYGDTVRTYKLFMESSGFYILENESVFLEDYNINLIGFDDYITSNDHYISNDKYNLITIHKPYLTRYIESDSEGFILAGHSHGNQVNIPFLVKVFLPNKDQKFVKGLYSANEVSINSNTQMFVSSGIGLTTMPYRFLNVPEIIVFNFKSKS